MNKITVKLRRFGYFFLFVSFFLVLLFLFSELSRTKKSAINLSAGIIFEPNISQDKIDLTENIECISKLRHHLIEPPSTEPYNLINPAIMDYSNGQTPFVDSRLDYKETGFFIECGALDGEKGSYTLFFEKSRKWTGILIEADPSSYALLKSKRRKAFTLNACLSPTPYPGKMVFNKAFNRGRLLHNKESKEWMQKQKLKPDLITIECFPLNLVLFALNRTHVDYFSLDVEGDELNVLKTIPFHKIRIEMLSVEYIHNSGKQGELQTFMEMKGYETLLKMQRDDGKVNDYIFKHK